MTAPARINILFGALLSACASRASDTQYSLRHTEVHLTQPAAKLASAVMARVPADRCCSYIRAVCSMVFESASWMLDGLDDNNSYGMLKYAPQGAPELRGCTGTAGIADLLNGEFGCVVPMPAGWQETVSLACRKILEGVAW